MSACKFGRSESHKPSDAGASTPKHSRRQLSFDTNQDEKTLSPEFLNEDVSPAFLVFLGVFIVPLRVMPQFRRPRRKDQSD